MNTTIVPRAFADRPMSSAPIPGEVPSLTAMRRLWLGDLIVVSFGNGRRVALVAKLGHDKHEDEPIAKVYVFSRTSGAWTKNTRTIGRRNFIRHVAHITRTHNGTVRMEGQLVPTSWVTPIVNPVEVPEPKLIEALAATKL